MKRKLFYCLRKFSVARSDRNTWRFGKYFLGSWCFIFPSALFRNLKDEANNTVGLILKKMRNVWEILTSINHIVCVRLSRFNTECARDTRALLEVARRIYYSSKYHITWKSTENNVSQHHRFYSSMKSILKNTFSQTLSQLILLNLFFD